MFVQIIEGRTNDAAGLKRQGERFRADVQPGAIGFLGVTAGATADGRAITIARFADQAAARANSERPEQSAFWAETEKYYDGEPTFSESSDVTEFLGGGSNEARFVQVMKVTDVERAKVERLDAIFETLAHVRPDLLGGIRAWTGPSSYVEVAYFTNEADARKGEQAEMPEEAQAMMAEFQEIVAKTEFLDLADPELH